MKLLLTTSLVSATHFRGGSYQFSPDDQGGQSVTMKQTWRKDESGYLPECTQADVENQNPATFALLTGRCYTLDGERECGSNDLTYTVTYVGDDFCYGAGEYNVNVNEPFSYGWTDCCWVDFTADDGTNIVGDEMRERASIYDLTNSTPEFQQPPLWLIMAGCDGQFIDLQPMDPDGDTYQCRWASQEEAGSAFTDLSKWPSLSLDQDNCIVHYMGSMDTNNFGLKPIALMIEDFDSDGNIRSSIPIQFLAQVWTPSLTRSIGLESPYPNWFEQDDDENSIFMAAIARGRRSWTSFRNRRSEPSYCTAVPNFVAPTFADGHELDATGQTDIQFFLRADSQLGHMSYFTYQGPLGLACGEVNKELGMSMCLWTPTQDQVDQRTHQFCFDGTDSLGLTTERRCIDIRLQEEPTTTTTTTSTTTTTTTTTSTTTTTTTSTTTSTTTTSTTTTTTEEPTTTTNEPTTTSTMTTTTTTSTTTTEKTTTTATAVITNTIEFATAYLTGDNGTFHYTDAENYGCAGRGNFQPFEKTVGRQLDWADRAFYTWKKCVQCATGYDAGMIVPYEYYVNTDFCGKLLC